MININELRRLAQEATPGPWIGAGPSFGESLPKYLKEVAVDREGDRDDGYLICAAPVGLNEECSSDMAFIAAANPGTIVDLLDRLEAAESDALEQARLNGMSASREAALMAKLEAAEKDIALKERIIDSLGSELNAVANERDDLLARIREMERQEPVAWLHETRRDSDVVTDAVKHVWGKAVVGALAAYSIPLYLAPGAQPAPSEKDEPIRKAWARFSNALHRSPDAPYPGMSEAFEKHFSQSFTDREWRAESGTWAAAWKAAKNHGAQPAPSIPEISDDLIEVIESRAEQSYRRHHGGIRGQQVTPADALSWHIIHATRDVLATAAQEAKP